MSDKAVPKRLVSALFLLMLYQPLLASAADDNPNQRMVGAVTSGQTKALKAALDSGANANGRFPDGGTPLMLAARRGWTSILELLIARGADLKAVDRHGVSALMWAVVGGNVPACKLLLEKGADIDARNEQGDTSLIVAALNGRKAVAELLIAKGADINARNIEGSTALVIAARTTHPAMARFLVEKGADVNIAEKSGANALAEAKAKGLVFLAEMLAAKIANAPEVGGKDKELLQAVAQGKPQVVKGLLAAGANPNARTDTGVPAIVRAALVGNAEIVGLLIGGGADVNTTNWAGASPLIFAADRGHLRVMELLLAKGADPNARDETQSSVLSQAAITGQAGAASLLLANGADVNAETNDGVTALMEAANSGHLDVVEILLSHEAAVNAASTLGNTALMYAARADKKDVVQLLLSKGADREIENNNGLTAADFAVKAGHSSVAKLILTAPAEVAASGKGQPDDIERPYAVLRVLTVQDVERAKQDDTNKKLPERERLDQATRDRLYKQLEDQAKPLAADELIVDNAYTTNEMRGGAKVKNGIAAAIFDGLSQAKYDRTAPRLPGGAIAEPVIAPPFPMAGSKAPPPDEPYVDRTHTLVARAVKYEKPGVSRPRPSPEEVKLWLQAQKSDATGPYRVYLSNFPNGSFADLARTKMPQNGKATVWVYRTESDRPTIFLNGIPILRIGGGEYFQLQFDGGSIELKAGNERGKKLNLNLQPGHEYFLRSDGTWSGEALVVEDEETAMPRIAKSRQVNPKWVHDPTYVRLN